MYAWLLLFRVSSHQLWDKYELLKLIEVRKHMLVDKKYIRVVGRGRTVRSGISHTITRGEIDRWGNVNNYLAYLWFWFYRCTDCDEKHRVLNFFHPCLIVNRLKVSTASFFPLRYLEWRIGSHIRWQTANFGKYVLLSLSMPVAKSFYILSSHYGLNTIPCT